MDLCNNDHLSKTRTHISISHHLLSLLCFEGLELIADFSINYHIVIGRIADHNCLIKTFVYSSIPLTRPLSTKAIPFSRPDFTCSNRVIYYQVVPVERGHHSNKATFSLQKG